jgi:hypothetical protein
VRSKTLVISATALAAAAALGLGGAALANAGGPSTGGHLTPLATSTGQPTDAATGTGRGNDNQMGNGYGRGQSTATPSQGSGQGFGPHDGGPMGGGRGWMAGEGLSGDTAVKVVQAAVSKEPTAILMGVGKGSDGTYRAMMERADGTHVLLTIDASFSVTGEQVLTARANGPGRGMRPSTATASPTA